MTPGSAPIPRFHRLSYVLWLLAIPTGAATPTAPGKAPHVAAPAISIDHIPVAVMDLDAAANTYRRLGFVIKPGRTHADGIRNQHVKFPDGAGIELIATPTATDALTQRYRKLLSQGDGPAYVSFHTASIAALAERLNTLGEPYSLESPGMLEFQNPDLQWLFFFAGSNRSPTDRPEHFAHTNTTNATIAVWIAGGDQLRMLSVFRVLGARIDHKRVNVPDPVLATVATVANGAVVFLGSDHQLTPGRHIVGVTFRTTDITTVRRVLPPAVLARTVAFEDTTHRSLFVSPLDALGMWLEFQQSR